MAASTRATLRSQFATNAKVTSTMTDALINSLAHPVEDGVRNVVPGYDVTLAEYGADGVCTNGDATFTVATGRFTQADVGKYFVINRAGPSFNNQPHHTTIASVTSSTEIELTHTPASSWNPAKYWYGEEQTTGIQNAIDDVGDAGGGTVLVPGPVFTDQLTLRNRVWLRGLGMRHTRLFLIPSVDAPVIINDSGSPNAQGVGVLDLMIDGNQQRQVSGSAHGIQWTRNPLTSQNAGDDEFDSFNLVMNVFLHNTKNSGYVADGRSEDRLINVLAYYCLGYGFDPAFDSFLLGCTSGRSGLAGFHLNHSSLRLTNCKAFYSGALTSNLGYGFFMENVTGGQITLAACEAQDNRSYGFYMDTIRGANLHITADSNSTHESVATALYMEDVTNSIINLAAIERFGGTGGTGPHGNSETQLYALLAAGTNTGNEIVITHSATYSDATINSAINPSSVSLEGNSVRANGQTPVLNTTVTPEQHNYLAWSMPPEIANNGGTLSAGTMSLVKIYLQEDRTYAINTISIDIATQGSTITAAFAGLYTSAGVLLQKTADQETAWESTGFKAMALAAQVTVEGGPGVWVYAAFLSSGGTPPAPRRSTTATNLINAGLAAGEYRAAQFSSGLSDLPASFTVGDATAGSLSYWVGLS